MENSPRTGAKSLGDEVSLQLFMFQRKKEKNSERGSQKAW